jgi:hypothetical protein
MNDAQLVQKYIELRDTVDAFTKCYEDKVKPYKEAMETIANAMLGRLNDQQTQSVKTEHGTAYVSTLMSAKVVDRDTFINYVMSHEAFNLLTSNVAKDAVKEFMENSSGQLPPGVDVTYINKCLFRRS